VGEETKNAREEVKFIAAEARIWRKVRNISWTTVNIQIVTSWEVDNAEYY
jgi:hypothetical protein